LSHIHKIRIFGDKFVENNKNKCKMIINDNEYELNTHINEDIINRKKSFEIKLKEIETITDMSYMFYECTDLPYSSQWDTFNVKNMSYMFYKCDNCNSFDCSKWDTSNVTNMTHMFYNCTKLPNISKWNTSHVKNMNSMFYNCKDLPDISKWNTSNVIDMSEMFCNCKDLPDISKWNTSNVNYMNCMFDNCKDLPDISQWNTSKVNNFSLSLLKSSPINVIFNLHSTIIPIIGHRFMTFSNLVKKLKIFANGVISNYNENIKFIYCGKTINSNSNELLKDLKIIDGSQITIN